MLTAAFATTAFVILASERASCGVAQSGIAGTEPPLIAIDVGHSLSRPGAISARGETEFSFNRELAVVLNGALRDNGLRTRLLGEKGDLDSLAERTAATESIGAAFLLSLHHDSVQPNYLQAWQINGKTLRYCDRFSGYSLFVSRLNPRPEESLACARAIGAKLRDFGYSPSLHHAEPIHGENRPLADAGTGVYFFDDLIVLKRAVVPAVLLEAGIIVNRDDELTLRQASTRKRLATAIAEGVRKCLGLTPKKEKTQERGSE